MLNVSGAHQRDERDGLSSPSASAVSNVGVICLSTHSRLKLVFTHL